MKGLSVRIDDSLGKKFDRVCRQAGYKKNTVITRLIEAYVQSQAPRARYKKRSDKGTDPFRTAVGMLDLPPLLKSPDEIDAVVYEI